VSVQALVGPQAVGDPDYPLRPAIASATIANCTGGVTITPPCKRILVQTAGTLVLTYAAKLANGQNATDTITCVNGQILDVVVIAVDGASTAAGVTFFWG